MSPRRTENHTANKLANRNITLTPQRVARLLEPFGVSGHPRLVEQVIDYTSLIMKWRSRINLTGIEDPEQIVQRLFGESFFGAHSLPINDGRLADVGSGAGFPGLALKLASPRLEVNLIEPKLKKAAFLKEVIARLDLAGVFVHRQRFEQVPAGLAFEWITSRGVGDHSRILTWARERLSPEGSIALWIGQEDAERLARTPGWSWRYPISVPLSKGRVILCGSSRGKHD